MKRIILLLVLILTLCVLISCANDAEIGESLENTNQGQEVDDVLDKEEDVPEGSSLYKNKEFSFIYSSDLNKTEDADGVLLANADGTLKIAVKSESKTDFYQNLDTKKYVDAVRGQGVNISTARVAQRNIAGVAITDITRTFPKTESEGAIYETIYAFSTKNNTYTITVTQPNDTDVDEYTTEVILNSLKVK